MMELDSHLVVVRACTACTVACMLIGVFSVGTYRGPAAYADVQFSPVADAHNNRFTIDPKERACRYTSFNNLSVSSNLRARTCLGHQHDIKCDLDKKRKLLVLYMHTHSNGYSITTEYDNLRLFLAKAVLAASTPTKLYSSVDYVFTRISQEVTVPTLVARPRDNVWFVHAVEKSTPCDLCAHGVAVTLLGINLTADYDSVLYLNSGVRGPYVHSDTEHWMDVLTMAGNPVLPLQPDGSVDDRHRAVTGGYHSFLWGGHLESWLVLAPRPAFGIVGELWAEACKGDFNHCINYAENQLRRRVEGELAGMATYATCQATLLNGASDTGAVLRLYNGEWLPEITRRWAEPCKCIFIKFGGSTFRNKEYRPEYVDRVQKMTIELPTIKLYSPPLVEPVLWTLG